MIDTEATFIEASLVDSLESKVMINPLFIVSMHAHTDFRQTVVKMTNGDKLLVDDQMTNVLKSITTNRS